MPNPTPPATPPTALGAPPPLESLFDHIPDAFVVLDRSWRYLFVNEAAARMGRHPKEAFRGRSLWDIYPDLVGTDFQEALTDAMARGVPVYVERYYAPFDAWFETRAFPVPDGLAVYVADISARKRAEKASKSSEERFALAFRASPDAMILSRMKDGRAIEVNESWERLFGFARAEGLDATSTAINAYVNPDDRKALYADLQAGRPVRDRELAFRHKSGTVWFGSLTCAPVTLDREACLLTIIRDVTAAKTFEKALADSREETRRQLAEIESIYNSAHIGLCVLDRDLRFVRINARLAEINGLPAAEHIGRTVREVLPGLADAAEKMGRTVFDTGKPLLNLEISGVTPAQPGVARTWLESWLPLADDAGRVAAISIVVEEVTEQRRAQAELRSLALFPKQNPSPVLRVTADDALQYANTAGENFLRGLGWRPGGPLPPAFLDPVRSHRHADDPSEFDIASPDGRTFSFVVAVVPTEHYANIYGRDVTDRRRAADEIRRLNAELEQKVAARTQELTQTVRELESFSYSISHDLRAPLRSIDGFSQAILEDDGERLSPSSRAHFDRIRAASQRMAGLIDDLLELSRLSRRPMDIEDVDLSAKARDIAEDLRRAAPERRVDVDIADGVMARGDRPLLRSVLQNLLDNAWKFTAGKDPGKIAFGATGGDGQTVYFVKDNGVGFDMAYAHKLFGAFQRLHGAEIPGTGIGLATVQRVVHRHGGRVWAEARPGEGAAFFFTLPGPLDGPRGI